jgi:hypothetical protein
MTGTPGQVEWAEEIKLRVGAEFSHVASVLRAAAARQTEKGGLQTKAILGILEEIRAEVLANNSAGYFIREWQEINGQVRQLLAKDSRYLTIQASERRSI